MSRSATVSVSWRIRSASVDFPWSMWAMIEKLRMWLWSMGRRIVAVVPRFSSPARPSRSVCEPARAVLRAPESPGLVRRAGRPASPSRARDPRRRALPAAIVRGDRRRPTTRRRPPPATRAEATTIFANAIPVARSSTPSTRGRRSTSNAAAPVRLAIEVARGSPQIPTRYRAKLRTTFSSEVPERDERRHPVRLEAVVRAVQHQHPAVEHETDREGSERTGDDRASGRV